MARRQCERRASPLSQCLEQEEDIEGFVIEEDDLESTLVRESYKHGVLVNSSRFYAYVKEDAPHRTRHRRPRWESLFLPSSRFQLAWNVIIVAVTVMMSVIEPFVIAFDYPMKLKGRGLSAAPIIDFVAGALFFIDTFVVNFLEAKVLTCRSTGRRKLITTPRLIRKIYILEGTFVTDVIVSVPFVVQIIASIKGESTPAERLTRILRLLRVLRVTGSSLTTPEILFMKLFRMTPMVIFIAQTLLVFALLVHSVACVYIFVAIQEGRDQSWLTQADLADGSNSEIYIVALYFATATITTVGFGDISAGSNDLERCVTTVSDDRGRDLLRLSRWEHGSIDSGTFNNDVATAQISRTRDACARISRSATRTDAHQEAHHVVHFRSRATAHVPTRKRRNHEVIAD